MPCWCVWLMVWALTSVVGRCEVTPPNFLVVVADDMRADAIRAHGGVAARTPVLDRMVAEGMSFRAAYCFGSNSGAVCIPSRAMLMTGRPFFSVRNDLASAPTLPERLEAKGYRTFLAGKWHNGRESCERSFAEGAAVFLGGMTDQFHPELSSLRGHRLEKPVKSDRFSTDAISEAAVNFLASGDSARPFFAWVSFTVPHDPRTPKMEADPHQPNDAQPPEPGPSSWRPRYDVPFARLHSADEHSLPTNFLPQHLFDNGWMTVRDEELLAWPRNPDEVRRELAAYHGLISHLDARLGDLLDTLAAAGLAENTYVIFLADHGLAIGSHGLLGKQSLYEHSMRAPLILKGPGVPEGRESQALVYLHDLHATVLDLAGAGPDNTPAESESQSLSPLWRSATSSDPSPSQSRQRLLLAFTDTMRAVRTDRWKLIRYPQVDVTQLFDLAQDPDERHNLADRLPERVIAMRRELEGAQSAAGDSQPWTAAVVRPAFIDLTARARDPYAARPWDRPAR
ncbi:MAG: sulfatase-like hydrolase/transferase [Verrucomicrobiales bacterium]